MKTGAILRGIGRYAPIHVGLIALFGFCWELHRGALLKITASAARLQLLDGRVLGGRVKRCAALIDWVAAHQMLAAAYAFLIIGCVAFLQIRGRPPWSCWLAALFFCAPWALYSYCCAWFLVALLI